MTLIAGIDPGATGACGILNAETGELVDVFDLPHYPNVGLDAAELSERLMVLDPLTVVVLEQQQAIARQVHNRETDEWAWSGSVSSAFALGDSYGRALATIQICRLSLRLVLPTKWKQNMHVTREKQSSLRLARELWPSAPLARVKDHGRAEALLLAEYGRRKHL
jgi:crossover junction endodeoxyribonuclease RuvC